LPRFKLIAATNRDLKMMVTMREFREDLYHRLTLFPVHVPPLRDRKLDIIHFAKYFVQTLSRGKVHLHDDCFNLLLMCSWSGNVRELEHMMERALCLLDEEEDMIMPNHLHFEVGIATDTAESIQSLTPTIISLMKKLGGWKEFTNAAFAEIYKCFSASQGKHSSRHFSHEGKHD
jgi:transcriptional regulator with GAF, ATPase, and Fis domain